ncbi:hypothetical protein AVEN_163194-1 [Araneus ventricosus]|uniref:Uncharacterized protein n=1 Tax=Araneus ventricosus TaxID=182803 RepID=A0A4Y2I7L5_ARAVE|nr:hypothetical protein AVEN_163194-1 [Araneus ventricosus]
MRLLDEFFSIEFDPVKDTIAIFIAKIKRIVKRLADTGNPLDDVYSPQLYRTDSRYNSGSYYRIFTKLVSIKCLEENIPNKPVSSKHFQTILSTDYYFHGLDYFHGLSKHRSNFVSIA